jgi:tRNA(fMet)-specific endonuclease VapC
LTPANGRFLLDTNIIIALLEGDDAVLSHLDKAAEVFIPAIALGELFFGAAKSGRASGNTDKVARFAAGRAQLKQRLKERGRPLPENDTWIAAAVTCYGLVLVTRDRHFREVDKLAIADWA